MVVLSNGWSGPNPLSEMDQLALSGFIAASIGRPEKLGYLELLGAWPISFHRTESSSQMLKQPLEWKRYRPNPDFQLY